MSAKWQVKVAQPEDFCRWMALVKLVQVKFHNLDLVNDTHYQGVVTKNIARRTAIYVENPNIVLSIIGAMMYSPSQNHISWLAVHPDYRRQGIGSALVEYMLQELPGRTIKVKTFLSCDPQGKAARPFYQKHGFVPQEIVEDLENQNGGYPFQLFVRENG